MKFEKDFIKEVSIDIENMETSSTMGINKESYVKCLKVNYVYSIISEMFILTMATLLIWFIAAII